MGCKKRKHLRELIDVLIKDKLFEKGLTKRQFDVFLEILKNVRNKGLKHCFSEKSRKGIKKYAHVVKKLLDRTNRKKTRMKKFRRVSKGFRNVLKHVLHDFLSNCLEENKCEN